MINSRPIILQAREACTQYNLLACSRSVSQGEIRSAWLEGKFGLPQSINQDPNIVYAGGQPKTVCQTLI